MGVIKVPGAEAGAPHLVPQGEVWVSPGCPERLCCVAEGQVGVCGRHLPSLCADTMLLSYATPVPSGENSSCAYLQNSTCRDNKHRGDSPTPGLFA